MNEADNTIYFCYAWEDLARVQQIAHEIGHEIETKLRLNYNNNSAEFDDTVRDTIANAEIVIVFISDASKQSPFIRRCVICASNLNKNILPLEIDKNRIFGPRMPKEFSFRSKIYSYHQRESKAAFLAQIKATLGAYIEEGDPYGAPVTFVADRHARIKRFDQDLGTIKPGSRCRFRLAKGTHQLRIEDANDPSLFILITIKITDPDAERFIDLPLTTILNDEIKRRK